MKTQKLTNDLIPKGINHTIKPKEYVSFNDTFNHIHIQIKNLTNDNKTSR